MIAPSIVRALRRANRPTAIILGLNEIASAIAVRAGRASRALQVAVS